MDKLIFFNESDFNLLDYKLEKIIRFKDLAENAKLICFSISETEFSDTIVQLTDKENNTLFISYDDLLDKPMQEDHESISFYSQICDDIHKLDKLKRYIISSNDEGKDVTYKNGIFYLVEDDNFEVNDEMMKLFLCYYPELYKTFYDTFLDFAFILSMDTKDWNDFDIDLREKVESTHIIIHNEKKNKVEWYKLEIDFSL